MISSEVANNQDWQTVVFKKKPQKYGTGEQDINAARRNNLNIETHKKVGGNAGNASINIRKVEGETEDFHHKKVPIEVAKAIEKGRLAKKLSQEALAKSLNMPKAEINEIERGTAIYNGQTLSKIKRFLGITV